MNRQADKVKDLIEVRSYGSLVDFHANHEETIKGYHFTDITSQMMVTWLDSISNVISGGVHARAMAGYRGVGKSHFLTALSIILSQPELRSEVRDSHVSASVNHLMRRKYPVAFVHRGSADSIAEELRNAIADALGTDSANLPDEPEQLLTYAGEQSGDVPFVILVDTAFGRESRVSRDDGEFLGRLSTLSKDLNIFVGIALDDDITGADGINAAIANSFSIDYLDQEHLYRIVDSSIFTKHRQAIPQLQEIYRKFREDLPAFIWSEQRFLSLYPLHPVILEIAPTIRFYVQDFALLGFASEAGKRILGRPSNSLIALDEIFDKVEGTLRKAKDLEETFKAFDAISDNAISTLPVMKRLQAKLILKALFVLSLDGNGTSAKEISASMLIYDGSSPETSHQTVADVLQHFQENCPEGINTVEDSSGVKYALKVAGKDDLNSVLQERLSGVPENVIPSILNRVAGERFTDWNISLGDDPESNKTDINLSWRGSSRKVRLLWNWGNEKPIESEANSFKIVICEPENPVDLAAVGENGWVWQPAELTSEEIEIIRRYYLLLHDDSLKNEFKEKVRAAGHTHSVAVGKIWERVFIKEAKLVGQLEVFEFSNIDDNEHVFGSIVSETLLPAFESRFPAHPHFSESLTQTHVNLVVNDLFSGVRVSNPEVQDCAESFGRLLGVVEEKDGDFVLASDSVLESSVFAKKVCDLIEDSEGLIPFEQLTSELGAAPFGLSGEAAQIVISSVVASRKAEFVTKKDARINHRSLDLAIIWDDIAGLAKPTRAEYSDESLNEWAVALTRLEDLKSLTAPDEVKRVTEALVQWLEDWNNADIVRRFASLPDELLNTSIWYVSVSVERSFSDVAKAIVALESGNIELAECLKRIADGFNESVSEFQEREKELAALISFIKSASLREEIWGYLAVCEVTAAEDVEAARLDLLGLLDSGFKNPNAITNQKIADKWKEFHETFSEHFARKHDSIMKSHQLQEKFEEFTKSDKWWEFDRLSQLPIFQDVHWIEANDILAHLRELDCGFAVRNHLKNQPFCACSFTLSEKTRWEQLPDKLEAVVDRALSSYRRTISMLRAELLKNMGELNVSQEFDPNTVRLLQLRLEKDSFVDTFSTEEILLLTKLVSQGNPSSLIPVAFPDGKKVTSTAELRSELGEWLDELPDDPVLLQLD